MQHGAKLGGDWVTNKVQSVNYSFFAWPIERERNQRFYNHKRGYTPSMIHAYPIPTVSVHSIMPVIDIHRYFSANPLSSHKYPK